MVVLQSPALPTLGSPAWSLQTCGGVEARQAPEHLQPRRNHGMQHAGLQQGAGPSPPIALSSGAEGFSGLLITRGCASSCVPRALGGCDRGC